MRRAAYRRHRGSGNDGQNGDPLVETQSANGQCLRFAAIRLFDESPRAREQKINPANQRGRTMQCKQAQQRDPDHDIPQNRIHRCGMNRDRGKLGQAADARAGMHVANSRYGVVLPARDSSPAPGSAACRCPVSRVQQRRRPRTRPIDSREEKARAQLQWQPRAFPRKSPWGAAARRTLHPLRPKRRSQHGASEDADGQRRAPRAELRVDQSDSYQQPRPRQIRRD